MGSSRPPLPLLVLRLTLVGLITAVIGFGGYLLVHGVPASGAVPASPIGGDLRDIDSSRPGIRVLFIGNSLTYVNDMPRMVQALAAHIPGQLPIYTYQYAVGGAWLFQAARSPAVLRLLTHHRWNYVVLQEDSHSADAQSYPDLYSAPAARALGPVLSAIHAQPVVFETWGYRHGNQTLSRSDSYARMQQRAQSVAQSIGNALDAEVAPVGYAWSRAEATPPAPDLWLSDSVHPSAAGSYLAASVFVDVLSGANPTLSTYTGGLPAASALRLREVATLAVQRTAPRGRQSFWLPPITGDPWYGEIGPPVGG